MAPSYSFFKGDIIFAVDKTESDGNKTLHVGIKLIDGIVTTDCDRVWCVTAIVILFHKPSSAPTSALRKSAGQMSIIARILVIERLPENSFYNAIESFFNR